MTATIALTRTPEMRRRLFRLVTDARFFEYPERFAPRTNTTRVPSPEYEITVMNGGSVHTVRWVDVGEMVPEAVRLRRFIRQVRAARRVAGGAGAATTGGCVRVRISSSLWSLRFDLWFARLLLWVASVGRDAELRPEAHAYFFDRYSRLAEMYADRGNHAKAELFRAKADEHNGGGDGPPYAAAMAMPRPRHWIRTDARADHHWHPPDDAREHSRLFVRRNEMARRSRCQVAASLDGFIAGCELVSNCPARDIRCTTDSRSF